jgi:nitronate monooxygenase
MSAHPALARAEAFCARFGLRLPVLLAPMAGACPPSLSIAVANAGGLGACGALLMQPAGIAAWAAEVRAGTGGPFQLNLWVPDPAPARDPAREAELRAFLAQWGPEVPPEAGDATPPDFAAQCEALLAAAPPVVSSVMGLYPPSFVRRLKERGITWWANVSTVAEARAAEEAGADVVVAQGMEAGGHRGCFDAARAEAELVGLFALLPAVADAVRVPVVATGGIADPRGVAAALLLGASAVQVGTGFLRCPEAKLHPAWAAALARTPPEGTTLTRAFSGRAGRSVATVYVRAAAAAGAPAPAPYPVQRGLTQPMRDAAGKAGDVERMQAWAGQAAAMARAEPAGEVARGLWERGRALLAM